MLTVWARLLGLDYLKQTIGPCVADIDSCMESFEVDPNRLVMKLLLLLLFLKSDFFIIII